MSSREEEHGGWPLREGAAHLRRPKQQQGKRRRGEEPPAEPVGEPQPEEPQPEEAQPEEPQAEQPQPEEPQAEAAPAVEEQEEAPPEEEPAPAEPAAEEPRPQHAAGELDVPEGYGVLEGAPTGRRRSVGIVISRFNGDITNRLLHSALEALEEAGVAKEAVTIMPVPGAFELPLAAMALAKTRRYACIVALGAVIRGETPHFDYVAGEAASGLQLAAIETGVPIAFGVLTCETRDQAEARVGRGADAVRSALEMADLFAHLRAASAAAAAR